MQALDPTVTNSEPISESECQSWTCGYHAFRAIAANDAGSEQTPRNLEHGHEHGFQISEVICSVT